MRRCRFCWPKAALAALACASVLIMPAAARAATNYEDSNPKLVFQGAWVTDPVPSGGTLKAADSPAAVNIAFQGTALTWLAKKGPALGKARVTVDYGAPVIVDLYRSSAAYRVPVWSVSGLASGCHVVRIEWTGSSRAGSSGTSINLDAVSVSGSLSQSPRRYEESNANMIFKGSWVAETNPGHSANAVKRTRTLGSRTTVTFSGTGVTWLTPMDPGYGKAKLTLDSRPPVVVDLYSPYWRYQRKAWGSGVLASGLHALRIEYTGQKNPAAGGTAIAVDAVDIVGTLLPGWTPASDKFTLWKGETKLRGANIYQRRVYPALDGPDFLGSGPFGPPYTQQDFNRLAALGANYVNLSHPGLFTQKPPYVLAQDARDNLDRMISMASRAGLFAVISFRTGPGRSDFTFVRDGAGVWFSPVYLNEKVWSDAATQSAWVSMWRYTAERYRANPVVVGYDLMVEPNGNDVGPGIWEPADFYAMYRGSLYDWGPMAAAITAGIRAVDGKTPILLGAMSYSDVYWLAYLKPSSDARTVYTAHQYAPHDYTHQDPGVDVWTYPGVGDLDYDGQPETFDRSWLNRLLGQVDAFKAKTGAPVATNEFGAMRWVPEAARFFDDQLDLFERRGMNHALWVWMPASSPFTTQVSDFNFRFGPNPANVTDVPGNALELAITKYWRRNALRPSG